MKEHLSLFGKVSNIVVDFANDHLFEQLPWAMLSIGIFLGGCLVLFIVKKLLGCILLDRKYRTRRVLVTTTGTDGKPRQEWVEKEGHPLGSIKHLFIELFFLVALVIVIWIAAHVAGFNFWTSSLVGVGLGLVGTYMFGIPIQAVGTSMFIYMTNKVEEGFYIEVDGVEGMITELHPLFVELEYEDAESKRMEHVQVPMTRLLTSIVKRNFNKEYAHRQQHLALQRQPTTFVPAIKLPPVRGFYSNTRKMV